MDALVSINGKILSPENAFISVFDRGFLFGDGVYETGKTVSRCPLFLKDHFDRLKKSAGKLSISFPWTEEFLKNALFSLLKAYGKDNAYFRIYVTRGCIDGVGLEKFETAAPNLVIFTQPLPTALDATRKAGIRLLTSKIVRNSVKAQDPDIKTSNYLNSLLALQDVRARGADDGVLCDAEGNVAEGTTFSVFGWNEAGELLTPSLDVGILNSITRKYLIEIAKKDTKVIEGCFPLEVFRNCREVFAASSVREIFPIREWDGVKYSGFEKSLALHQRFTVAIAEYVKRSEKF